MTRRVSVHASARGIVAWVALGAIAMVAAPQIAAAQQAPPEDAKSRPAQSVPPSSAPPSSLDDALLQDLDNELLEGSGDLKKRPKPDAPPGGRPADKPADAAGEPEVSDDTMPAEDADPLVHISQEMRSVEELIPQSARRPHAEQLQQRIIDDLARLIDQAESQRAQQSPSKSKQRSSRSVAQRQQVKQPKQSQGNSGKASNQPARDSTNRLGKDEAARPDPAMFRGIMKDAWGHLPARDREQVLQNTPDKFLPQYELMIEKYYQRLAEDQESK